MKTKRMSFTEMAAERDRPAPSPGLREALVDILAHCDEANVVYAHQPNCTCDRCIIGRIARKALEEGSDG